MFIYLKRDSRQSHTDCQPDKNPPARDQANPSTTIPPSLYSPRSTASFECLNKCMFLSRYFILVA